MYNPFFLQPHDNIQQQTTQTVNKRDKRDKRDKTSVTKRNNYSSWPPLSFQVGVTTKTTNYY